MLGPVPIFKPARQKDKCKRAVPCRKKVAPFQAQAVPCPKRYSVNEVLVLYNIFAILRERLLFRAVISTEEK